MQGSWGDEREGGERGVGERERGRWRRERKEERGAEGGRVRHRYPEGQEGKKMMEGMEKVRVEVQQGAISVERGGQTEMKDVLRVQDHRTRFITSEMPCGFNSPE